MTFKTIRISILILILAYIGIDTLLNDKRSTDWKRSLRVVVYPINADGSDSSREIISKLDTSYFENINTLLKSQASHYGLNLSEPIRFDLAPELKSKPPVFDRNGSVLSTMLWSIKLRYWSWKNDNYTGPKAQIKAYALFFDPKTHKVLAHSTGLKKSKIAINNLFADEKHSKQNNIVLLHELLHTLGATDKYDLRNGFPTFPHGYANTQLQPLYPQKKAEIMGGRIPLSTNKAVIPSSLNDVVFGKETAKEIGWIK